MNFNFFRTAVGIPIIEIGDCKKNCKEIIYLINQAYKNYVDILVFPELSLTGCTCMDLFFSNLLLDRALESLNIIIAESINKNMLISVGMPIKDNNKIYNCVVLIFEGKILGIVPKINITSNKQSNEGRWFSDYKIDSHKEIIICGQKSIFGNNLIFYSNNKYLTIGVEVGSDLFSIFPPSSILSNCGASLILNPTAIYDSALKDEELIETVKNHSKRIKTSYVFANAGYGESTSDNVYSGYSFIFENGNLLNESEKFNMESSLFFADLDLELLSNIKTYNKSVHENTAFTKIFFDLKEKKRVLQRNYLKYPFFPNDKEKRCRLCEDILNIEAMALIKRFKTSKSKKIVLGISGGLDSTLALIICIKAFDKMKEDRKNIIGITMQGFGTTGRTYNNSIKLIDSFLIEKREISIKNATLQHFKDIGHDKDIHDVTYENSQARERTQILMDIANKENGLVIGTGDLSEIALGWSTYNGDHMSMYSVNSGIPKTLIKIIIEHVISNWNVNYKFVLEDILKTPVSPELLPADDNDEINQKTEDLVGPYILNDFFLYHMQESGFGPKKIFFLASHVFKNEFESKEILKWLKIFYHRFFTSQFKRSCSPDGVKVLEFSLSSKTDFRMPSDVLSTMWQQELDDF